MVCKNCGEELKDDAKFCYKCGAKIYDSANGGNADAAVNNADETETGEAEFEYDTQSSIDTEDDRAETQAQSPLDNKHRVSVWDIVSLVSKVMVAVGMIVPSWQEDYSHQEKYGLFNLSEMTVHEVHSYSIVNDITMGWFLLAFAVFAVIVALWDMYSKKRTKNKLKSFIRMVNRVIGVTVVIDVYTQHGGLLFGAYILAAAYIASFVAWALERISHTKNSQILRGDN